MRRRAIFLDRDGTINIDTGYISAVEQFQLYDFAAPAIRLINQSGWLAIVVTNQAVIGRGLCREEDVAGIHAIMSQRLAIDGARIDAVYCCPHYPPEDGATAAGLRVECECRKPRPGLIRQAGRDHALDLDSCWMIGDRYRDLAAGFAAGTRGLLVRTGHGSTEYERDRAGWARQPDGVAANLYDAVGLILQLDRPRNEEDQ